MQQEAEFVTIGTVPAAKLPALLTLLSERCGAGTDTCIWERRFKSKLPQQQRGLQRLSLLSDRDGSNSIIRAQSVDRLSIAQLVTARQFPVLLAHRVSRVPVDAGAPHFVAALGFELEGEALRRGVAFRDGATSISCFELCRRRAGADATANEDGCWEPLGDGSLRLVEVLVHGSENLAPLAQAADQWVDALDKLVDLSPAASARANY